MKINLNEKEYESGKITREKYKKFAEVYESLLGKDKHAQTFSDEDLDAMLNAIVEVYGNQFTFEEADEELDEISSIITNFAMINAEILAQTNVLAEEVVKAKKADFIYVNGKTYKSGKIGRKKYRAFRTVYERLVIPGKETYTDAELDEMLNAIVAIYDNQFTFEEVNEELEDVADILFNFGLINANIILKTQEEVQNAKKNLSSHKS